MLTAITALLDDTAVSVFEGPAPKLPTDTSGHVTPSVVILVAAGAPRHTITGRTMSTVSGFTIICVGADQDWCLNVVDQVRAALHGARIDGRVITQEPLTGLYPTPEPGLNPPRVSLPLTFTVHS